MAETYDALVRKRGSCKSKVTIFKKYVDACKTKTKMELSDLIELSDRLDKFEDVLDEFEVIQDNIELVAEKLDGQEDERSSFTDNFYSAVANAKQILRANNFTSQVTSGNQAQGAVDGLANPVSRIKLPTIKLPAFDGTYQSWLAFRDTFDALIHKSHIEKVEKFHHLKSALEESPAWHIISSLEFSSNNYDAAWKSLCDRYNNVRLLVHNHVKSLYGIESMKQESAEQLRNLSIDITKHLQALKQLKQPTDQWDTLIVYMASTKLDSITRREWENFKIAKEIPTLEEFQKFLKGRADLLETLQGSDSEKARDKSKAANRGLVVTEDTIKCANCSKHHYIYTCEDFLGLNAAERSNKAMRLKLCLNCLKPGHFTKQCRRGTCKKCTKKHHTLLHREQAEKSEKDKEPPINTSCKSVTQLNGTTLLSTAYVDVHDSNGAVQTIRLLLDNGSDTNFITESLCKRLKLMKTAVNSVVTGINNCQSNIKACCKVTIHSRYDSYKKTISCLVLDEICGNIPNAAVKVNDLDVPDNIKLAEPSFHKPGKVDMLIGAGVFWELMSVGQKSLGLGKPLLQKTRLGWLVSGQVSGKVQHVARCNFSQTELHDELKRFWEIEECSLVRKQTKDEISCEEHFQKNTQRDKHGMFVVAVPLKIPAERLGESFEQAKRRFLGLEKKLESNPGLRQKYVQFMSEYKELGHMSLVKNPACERVSYYLPHHGVIREESLTTKLRVVFDASSPTSSGLSLNHLQFTGQTLQNELFSILLRFRKHNYVVAGDIEKMYRQVALAPEFRALHRIVWRENPSNALEIFELNTVTYGTTAASFLAIRCLFQLAKEVEANSPKIAETIKNDFYVDDMLTGHEDLEEAAKLVKGVSDVLKKGCFVLRKFYSNHPLVLKYVKESDNDTNIVNFGENENAKTLGLIWKPTEDNLRYNVHEPNSSRLTKRVVLSEISRIFDPLGLLAPCVVIAKMMIQKLWLERLAWDQTLPRTLSVEWGNFTKELPALNELRIKRQIVCKAPIRLELHGFSDSSERAYGAAIYARSIDSDGKIFVNLLCAKAKVAPLKVVTLPRLELCGAVVLARLAKKVCESLCLHWHEKTFWTDSTVVLGWLKMEPSKLKTFVSTRVSEIQELTVQDKWRHVPGKHNPADLLSRGVKPKKLIENEIWWHGPSWLSQEKKAWPKEPDIVSQGIPEVKRNIQQCLKVVNAPPVLTFEKYSCLSKLIRVVAYILRFKTNCLKKDVNHKTLNSAVVSKAELCLIKLSQIESFKIEIADLKLGKNVSQKSRLSSLNPFLDNDGVIRVGGRIQNSEFSYAKKHPIVLCGAHPFSKLVMRSEHLKLLHAGPNHLLASVRETYWPIGGRTLAKKVVRECVRCFRFDPRVCEPIMGNLPEDRLQPRFPFEIVGVDYAGPYLIKNKEGRGCTKIKGYVCLFVCFVTKAIHLELVTGLTKEGFIMALRRFAARRGKPARVYSDNGTNFVGSHNEIQEFVQFIKQNGDELVQSFASEGIDWRFIPPRAPHFGGLWEAGVKSTKHHLKQVLGDSSLTFESFYTLLVQIESILNSRPLTPLSSSPLDLNPLTPSHFLIGRAATNIPEVSLTDLKVNRLSLHQHLQQLKQHFWSRWSKEYLAELQVRTKWQQSQSHLSEGTLCLIKEDNLPPMAWRMGRIVRVIPGKDGEARVAELRTSTGIITRAFSKICPLPINECDNQNGDKNHSGHSN